MGWLDLVEVIVKSGAVWFVTGCGLLLAFWDVNDKPTTWKYRIITLLVTVVVLWLVLAGIDKLFP